ncbi:MAG: leucyl/phenylalanyl-tRNA--protein transferase [Proteobacteria bacterium]|nr:leucyl/phenylalanyl-tRNA--protein transferase [Desulfobacula sp.]MBU4130616.1 leucyl/phenylalanyl-tRNA--protein transferase [Pseudomonadota bacterium]
MPLFRLSEKNEFPPAWLARSDGLLCIGGDLRIERLLLAYQNGIFPWFSKNEPLLWWSPDPRLVLFPEAIKISRSLKKKIKQTPFRITVDNDFEQTIVSCAQPRRGGHNGTWLVEEMIDAYIRLHKHGYAHSIETWHGNSLVGGLYGVCLGGIFFGESMFSNERDASKIALSALTAFLTLHGFDMIDCQVTSHHLLNMGAVEISRDAFLKRLIPSTARRMNPDMWDPSRLLDPLLPQ